MLIESTPKSAAAEGCTYTLGIWKRLIRFLDYPQLELSNNLAENSMRPIAVGRGNWIHIGSEQAAANSRNRLCDRKLSPT